MCCGCYLPRSVPMPLRKLAAFLSSPLNIIDLLAIVPFYVNLWYDNPASPALQAVRVLRIGRVLSLFKLARHHTGLTLLAATMQASAHMLAFLLFFVGLAVTFFGSIM